MRASRNARLVSDLRVVVARPHGAREVCGFSCTDWIYRPFYGVRFAREVYGLRGGGGFPFIRLQRVIFCTLKRNSGHPPLKKHCLLDSFSFFSACGAFA